MKKKLFFLGAILISSLQIQAQNSQYSALACVDGLGGASDPTFLNFEIMGTTLSHETLNPSTVFYHEYPQDGNTTANLQVGHEYSFFTFTSSEAVVGLWVDYNHDNNFDESEFTLLVNSMNSQNYSNFTLSENALPGNTKIRLRTRAYGSTINGQNACTTFGSGETRDYTVNIVENLSVGKFDKVSSSLRVFPNPATEIVTVGKSEEVRQVTLFDVSGKMIASSKENVIDISNYSKGLYIAKVLFVNGSTSVGKIVKE